MINTSEHLDQMMKHFHDMITLLPRIQAHPLVGTSASNPNKDACA